MTITAKFASKCACCGGRIEAGEKIEWTKGMPAKHTACPSNPAASAPKTRKASAPRLPTLVGEEGPVLVRFDGARNARTPDKYAIGEAAWIKDSGMTIAMVCVGYEPARWLSSDMLEDNGDYGYHGRGAFLGMAHFRSATPAEYEALQLANPRLNGVCEESRVAVALTAGLSALARVS